MTTPYGTNYTCEHCGRVGFLAPGLPGTSTTVICPCGQSHTHRYCDDTGEARGTGNKANVMDALRDIAQGGRGL